MTLHGPPKRTHNSTMGYDLKLGSNHTESKTKLFLLQAWLWPRGWVEV